MKRTVHISFLMLLFIGIIFMMSCSARRVGKEWDMSETSDPVLKEGRLVFKNNCQRCHPGGEAGVGPPLNAIHLPGFLLKARVRSRAFLLWTGRMPSFDKHEISKKELRSLVYFLKEMEKRGTKKDEAIK